jgi:hypothetical protein
VLGQGVERSEQVLQRRPVGGTLDGLGVQRVRVCHGRRPYLVAHPVRDRFVVVPAGFAPVFGGDVAGVLAQVG